MNDCNILDLTPLSAFYLLRPDPFICLLYLPGVVFAVNSAVHSYLILDYTDGDKVALNVGFYYIANAGGRLIGCLLSGLLYQWAGLAGCLWGTVAFCLAAAGISLGLPPRALHPDRLSVAAVGSGDGD